MRQGNRRGSFSDQLYNWSDIIAFLFIVNPFCRGSNQIVKLEQTPRVQNWSRFNQARVRRQHGLVCPIAGDGQTAFFLVVKTEDFPSGNLPDFEDGVSPSFERMKRMSDQSPSQRGIGGECSLQGLSRPYATEWCRWQRC